MPPRRKGPRCSYKEGNRRCPFGGTGDPPFCAAHQLAVADAARPRAPVEVLWTSFVAAVNGERVDPRALSSALDDWIRQWRPRRQADQAGWYPPPPPGQQRQAPPHNPDAERAQMRQAARRVMGFPPTGRLTEQAIKERKRTLAMQHHPDRGGSVQAMAAINDAADVLLEELSGG